MFLSVDDRRRWRAGEMWIVRNRVCQTSLKVVCRDILYGYETVLLFDYDSEENNPENHRRITRLKLIVSIVFETVIDFKSDRNQRVSSHFFKNFKSEHYRSLLSPTTTSTAVILLQVVRHIHCRGWCMTVFSMF